MRTKRLLVCVGLLSLSLSVFADGPADQLERKDFFPNRKQAAVKGTISGILLTDGQPVLSTEGRSGPADQLVFSSGRNSYRWVYVPTLENPQITNLQVPVGEKGEVQVYPALNMANPRSVVPWGITQGYTLVEITVNGGQGSPAGDSFVATSMKVLEGSKEYPLKVGAVIKDLKKRYAEHLGKHGEEIEKQMAAAGKKALGDKKATGPREKSELMYVTWLPDKDRLEVRFLSKVSDGAFSVVQGGPGGRRIDLPPLKLPIKKLPPQPQQDNPFFGIAVADDEEDDANPFFRAAPPRPINMKVGVAFGIEFGMLYETNKEGEVTRSQALGFQPFQQNLQVPAGIGPIDPRLPPRPGLPPQQLPPQRVID
jgi:hypothetical protein